MDIIIHLFVFAASLFGFVYGCVCFIARRKALYLWLITFGTGCALLKNLFELLQLLVTGSLPHGFHVGMLGAAGTFMFFCSANFGVMDSLADDGSRMFLKYRLLGLLAPVLLVVLYLPALTRGDDLSLKIPQIIVLLPILSASYYHFKHLIFPDVDFGVVRCIRGYNFLALLFAVCAVLNMDASALRAHTLYYATELISGAILLCILPVLGMEVKKWLT